ncbi:hypothetical protein [Candidatus Bathycorpusculum sp.]|uniref:hypothetical protein n=1 Tax=Candidatus Bathycorpusculum sp. TaxID=2994959 RepID=UPI00282F1242|nr:hypothetical protein [Candidatus Termitimicrobium sp.]MCL2432160.1 hypothetical protein [Candidatus Termitimicrobium sp.]
MKKKSITLFSILLLFCVCVVGEIIAVDAADDVLDNLQIPSDGTSVVSNIALQDGISYEIVASGTYNTGGTPIINYQQDAMYTTQDNWATHTSGQNGLYIDCWTVGSKQWDAFNAEHIYRYTIVGNGSKISFRIHDTSFKDNSGSIYVQILGSPTVPQSPTPTSTAPASTSTSISETPPPSTWSTPNTPTNPDTTPTLPVDASNASPTPTSPTNTSTSTGHPELFGNTFVIVTTLIVTVAVASVLIFTLRKSK